MKNLLIAAFVLCSGIAFSQTVPQSNSRASATEAGTLIQGTPYGFLVKAKPNAIAVSNKKAGNGNIVNHPVEATNEKVANTPVSNDRPKK